MIVTTTLKLIYLFIESSIPRLILYTYTKYHMWFLLEINYRNLIFRFAKLREFHQWKNLATTSITNIPYILEEKLS